MSRILFLTLLLSPSLASQQSDWILEVAGIFRSVSCKRGPCYGKLIGQLDVQRALLAAAKAPISSTSMTELLSSSGTSPSDLEALRLVRRQGDRYRIAFTLLPAEDVRRVRAAAEASARHLVDSLLARRADIEAALQRYAVPGVDRGDVAFIVLGCFSLDWDGLRIAKAGRYRTEKGDRPDGHYVAWAEERIDDAWRSFCRSSSSIKGNAGVVSFGDGTRHDGYLVPGWQRGSRGAALGSMLLAMRDGKSSVAELAQAARLAPSDVQSLLLDLTKRHYIRPTESGYAFNFPVLSRQDSKMVDGLRKIGREAINSWLTANYSKLKAELAGTAPVRAGVPYEEVFNLVWHHVFGRANAMLADSGLFSDPYAERHIWRQYTPAVFSRVLIK